MQTRTRKENYIYMIHLLGLATECKKLHKVNDLNKLSLYRLKRYYDNAIRQKMYVMEGIEV